MPKQYHPVTGCRMDTVFGIWLLPHEHLEQLVGIAWKTVENEEQLKRVSQSSGEMHAEADEKPYTVQDGIARFSLSGPLTKYDTSFSSLFGGTSTMRVRRITADIMQDSSVKGTFVDVDSWGGTAEGNAECAMALGKLAAAKPLYMHAEDKATSAALMLGVQGIRFTASRGASIGSVGTMLRLVDRSKQLEGQGVRPVIVKAGEYKGIGADGQPITEKDKVELQRYVDQINQNFVNSVQTARKLSPEQLKEVTTARVFVGEDALRVGLIDAVCTADEAYDSLKQSIERESKSGPTPLKPNPAASRRTAMLTAAQLEQARKLPGAAGLTEENADVSLLNVATTLNGQVTTLQTQVAGHDAKITELNGKLAGIPKKDDPEILKGRAELAQERVDLLVQKGTLTSAQATIIKGALMKDGKPNEALLTVVNGQPAYMPFVTALSENKPNGIVNQLTGAQPAPKTEPGSGPQEAVPSLERMNALRNHAGLPLVPAKVG